MNEGGDHTTEGERQGDGIDTTNTNSLCWKKGRGIEGSRYPILFSGVLAGGGLCAQLQLKTSLSVEVEGCGRWVWSIMSCTSLATQKHLRSAATLDRISNLDPFFLSFKNLANPPFVRSRRLLRRQGWRIGRLGRGGAYDPKEAYRRRRRADGRTGQQCGSSREAGKPGWQGGPGGWAAGRRRAVKQSRIGAPS